MLTQMTHEVSKPKFSVIDYHNHPDAQSPEHVLAIMDECGNEHIVNSTMKAGDEAIAMIDRYNNADAKRFSTIGWMDWDGVERSDFIDVSVRRLEKLVAYGIVGFKIWKDFGLSIRDASGDLMRVDDERLAPVFERCGQLNIPIMVHIGDPEAFFLPIDSNNEQYEELAAHPDWSFHGAEFSKSNLLDQRDSVFDRHPRTTFIAAHVAENVQRLTAMLHRNPNVLVDIGARASELGRQPYSARRFFLEFADRILFGADLAPDAAMYRLYYRFLGTEDGYFEYPTHASGQGALEYQRDAPTR